MGKYITFILNVRFPTEKAYGVTTEFTLRAIEETKTCLVTVITPNLDKNLNSNLRVLEVRLPFADLYNYANKSWPSLGPYFFTFWKMFYPFKLLIQISKSNNLIWSRDIFTSLVFSLAGFNTLCEIHRTPSKLDSFFLFILKRVSKSNFAFISIFLRDKLKINSNRSIVLPMAVNKKEIVKRVYQGLENEFIIGYVGSPSSSGNKLLLDCIYEAALYFSREDSSIIFRLVGIEKKDFGQLTLPKNLVTIGRVSRDTALVEIDKFKIGLVLYPETKYFFDSFPIKIVEYAARGVPILASSTSAHRNILGNFNADSSISLINAIIYLKNNNVLLNSLSKSAQHWVRNFTFQNRAKQVLTFDRLWNDSATGISKNSN
jgi:glycosyltransferase involved in cell wall biosynthesis